VEPALLLGAVIMGGVCAAVARAKGRHPIAWFFVGLLLGLIGLVLVLVVSNENDVEAERQHADRERRRLAEQLQQERLKNEVFRRHAFSRLDAHDQALGLETRAVPALALAGPALETRGALARAAVVPRALGTPPAPLEPRWHYESLGQPRGPIGHETLLAMLESGTIPWTTLVWTEGQAGWLAAEAVPALRAERRP
jgi:hypothetical protein